MLNLCIQDAKNQGKLGVAVLVTQKHWLPKKGLFRKHGFKTVAEYRSLSIMVLKFEEKNPNPTFILNKGTNPLKNLQNTKLEQPLDGGITIYAANQCPYTHNLIKQLKSLADKINVPFSYIKISNRKEVLASPHPYGTCAIFYKRKFLS
jgi:hypothetical protein